MQARFRPKLPHLLPCTRRGQRSVEVSAGEASGKIEVGPSRRYLLGRHLESGMDLIQVALMPLQFAGDGVQLCILCFNTLDVAEETRSRQGAGYLEKVRAHVSSTYLVHVHCYLLQLINAVSYS